VSHDYHVTTRGVMWVYTGAGARSSSIKVVALATLFEPVERKRNVVVVKMLN